MLKHKAILYVAAGALSFLLFLTPLIAAGGIIAVPVLAIHDVFTSIGDFIFGGDKTNDVVKIIQQYLDKDDTKKMIRKIYQPLIDKEKDKDIPLNWLVIPNLLAGIDPVTTDMVSHQIDIIKACDGVSAYIDKLRLKEPYKSGFGTISTTTIVGYINSYNSYLGQEDNIDVGNLAKEKFLYPLKKKAIVTSDFGARLPVTLPNGHVVSSTHTGIDLAYAGGNAKTCGVPIYAAMPGEVVANERTQSQAGANWGEIRYKNLDVLYLHLRDPFPYDVGTKIQKGQFVGYIGESGLATGCHLHFETHVDGKVVSPHKFLDF